MSMELSWILSFDTEVSYGEGGVKSKLKEVCLLAESKGWIVEVSWDDEVVESIDAVGDFWDVILSVFHPSSYWSEFRCMSAVSIIPLALKDIQVMPSALGGLSLAEVGPLCYVTRMRDLRFVSEIMRTMRAPRIECMYGNFPIDLSRDQEKLSFSDVISSIGHNDEILSFDLPKLKEIDGEYILKCVKAVCGLGFETTVTYFSKVDKVFSFEIGMDLHWISGGPVSGVASGEPEITNDTDGVIFMLTPLDDVSNQRSRSRSPFPNSLGMIFSVSRGNRLVDRVLLTCSSYCEEELKRKFQLTAEMIENFIQEIRPGG